jgi:hypothetical protein
MQTKKVKYILEMEIGIAVEPQVVADSIERLIKKQQRLYANGPNLAKAVKVTPMPEKTVPFPIPQKSDFRNQAEEDMATGEYGAPCDPKRFGE